LKCDGLEKKYCCQATIEAQELSHKDGLSWT